MRENALLYTILGGDPKRGAHAKCEGCIAWMRASVRGGKASCNHLHMRYVQLTATLQPLDESLDLGGDPLWRMRHLKGEVRTSF